MSDLNPEPAEDGSPPVPTIEEERHFLAQCEYVNRTITAWGRKLRALLRQRGWGSEWTPVDQEEVWSKSFPDGVTQHLSELEAYRYEQEQARRSCEDRPKEVVRSADARSRLQHDRQFLAQCEELNRGNAAIGALIGKLLRQRGWHSEWSEAEQEEFWSKTFPDGAMARLIDNDAYAYEYRQTRQFFRDTKIAIKPRRGQKPPISPP